MADWIEPLLPLVRLPEGMSPGEIEAAGRDQLIRQRLLEEVLLGQRPPDDFHDALRMDGLDPDNYWEVVETQVDAVIARGETFDGLEFLGRALELPGFINP